MEGFVLPNLNSTSNKGNYGGIIVVDSASYNYPTGWASAITSDMWYKIYEYQLHFKVRLVRINEYPGPQFGKSFGDTQSKHSHLPTSRCYYCW